MNGLLVRIGIDSTREFGGWNAPMDQETGDFVFVPILDTSYNQAGEYIAGGRRLFEEVCPALADFAMRHNFPASRGCRLPEHLSQAPMHLDPDFVRLTYGDGGTRARNLRKFVEDDFLAFYAALRSLQTRELIYALIGIMVLAGKPRNIDEVPDDELLNNAHTRWAATATKKDDLVVRGKPTQSGLFDRCIPVGGWRDGAYRVNSDLLEQWGGLDIKNGWIQRSANPPKFQSPERFRTWLEQQSPRVAQAQFSCG